MPGPPTILQFDWSGVRQDKNARKLQPGELTELVNVRYPKDSTTPEKRHGHVKTTVSTFSGGTYQGPATEMLLSPTELWRDSADQIWARDALAAYYRGEDPRCFPTWSQVQNIAGQQVTQPRCVLANGDLWFFYMVADTTGYVVAVLDPLTGVVKFEPTKINMAGVCAISAVADENGVVYLLGVNFGIAIFCDVFNSPTATPTHKVFAGVGGEGFLDVDARLLPASGKIIVAAVSNPGSTINNNTLHAFMSTSGSSKGNALTSPAPVFTLGGVTGSVGDPICAGGISILDEDGSSGVVRFSWWRSKNSTDVQLMRIKASASTLHVIDNVEIYSETVGSNTQSMSLSGGILDGSNEVYFSTNQLNNTSGAPTQSDMMRGIGCPVRNATVRRHTYNGTSTTNDVVARSAYLVSRPFSFGGKIYFVSGFDDSVGAQRSYWLRTADGTLVTSILDGEAAAVGITGTPTPVQIDSTHVILPLAQESFVSAPAPAVVTLDFAAAYRSDAPNITTGGIPKYVSPQDVIRELALLQAPFDDLTVTDGDGLVTYDVEFTYSYATIDSGGLITRSDSRAIHHQVLHGYDTFGPSLDIPTLRHTCGPTFIELWGSVAGGGDLFLQQQIINDPTVDSIHLSIFPDQWSDRGELLPTTGGALGNTPTPPARLATIWRDRVFLAGTPEGEIWESKEKTPGRSWEFSGELTFEWHDGTGPITAIHPFGSDLLVVFKQDAVGIVQGLGPDNNAQGTAFTVSTLSTKKGVTNPHAVAQHPLGVTFENAADGRMCLCTGGQIVEIHQGQDNYTAYVPRAALPVESERGIRWFCSNTKQLFLDFAHAPADGTQPAGTWIRDENSTLPAFVGARLIAGIPTMLEPGTTTTASFWTPNTSHDDDGVVCLTDWTTGSLAGAGALGEFDTDRVWLSSTHRGGDSTYNYILTDDSGNNEVHPDVASDDADVSFRTALYRARDFTLRVQETSATGAGRAFDGVAIEIRPYGRLKNTRNIG